MVWGTISLPVKDTVRLVGLIKAECGYKRGIYLDEEENSNLHHPLAPTWCICIALLSTC